ANETMALGPLRAVHPGGSKMLKVNIAIASFFTLLLGGFAGYLLIRSFQLANNWYLAAAWFGGLGLVPGIGLILLIRKFSWGLYLFENGFVFAAGKDRVVLWDDVAQLFEKQDVVAGMRADKWLRLVLKDGSEVKMDSAYKDFSAFNEVLTNKVAEAVLQRAIA